jgi:tRNA threonylcarbamoyladenosine biosynthesis protein TsaE
MRACDTCIAVVSDSEDETRALAARLAGAFVGGEVIGLRGDLGAGKTVFVQGLAQGLGVCEPATSPSFVIAHCHLGRLRLWHVDLYRLESDQAEGIGLDDLIGDDSVIAIEWAERLPQHLRRRLSHHISIEFAPAECGRELRIFAAGASGPELLRRAAAALTGGPELPCDPSASRTQA